MTVLDKLKQVPAEKLSGPRVYSTDLMPSLLDAQDPVASLDFAARALKIKLITKSQVTLNAAHLVGPLGLMTFKSDPGLIGNGQIIPAIRSGTGSLSDLIREDKASYKVVGLEMADARHLADEIEGALDLAMPWDVGGVADQFRASLLSDLNDDNSLIVQQLRSMDAFSDALCASMVASIQDLDLTSSANLSQYIEAELDPAIAGPFQNFASLRYHQVGTGVVNSETGTDLSPLSRLKETDLTLVGRDSELASFSEDAVFLQSFLGSALHAIYADRVFPAETIDVLSFAEAAAIGRRLRENGFAEYYENILQTFAKAVEAESAPNQLERLDAMEIAVLAGKLKGLFAEAANAEKEVYVTRDAQNAKGQFLSAGTDVFKNALSIIPGVGWLVSVFGILSGIKEAAEAADRAHVPGPADHRFRAALEQRDREVEKIIGRLAISGGAQHKLLRAAATLHDVYNTKTRRP